MHRVYWTRRLFSGPSRSKIRSRASQNVPSNNAHFCSPSFSTSSQKSIGRNGINARQEIKQFADMAPTPLCIKDILEQKDPWQAAKFLHSEDPVRTAERISLMESIPQWEDVPELVEQHSRHVRAFSAMRSIDPFTSQKQQDHLTSNRPSLLTMSGRGPRRTASLSQTNFKSSTRSTTGSELDEFTNVVRKIIEENRDGIGLMSKAVHRLYNYHYDPTIWSNNKGFISARTGTDGKTCQRRIFLDQILDDFFLNRLGCNVLMHQYLALIDGQKYKPYPSSDDDSRYHGIVDPECNVTELCKRTARAVLEVYENETGMRPPTIKVEAYSACNKNGEEEFGAKGAEPTLPFIPSALSYILQELLKNSCQATFVKKGVSEQYDDYVKDKPIKVIVSADDSRMLICVSDQAGGIPFEHTSNVWSYLYTTSKKDPLRNATELSGYGVGLPLSRLYCRYFGGTLNLVSLPGYGTNAYIYLPRLSSDLVEMVPDKDNAIQPDWNAPMNKFVL